LSATGEVVTFYLYKVVPAAALNEHRRSAGTARKRQKSVLRWTGTWKRRLHHYFEQHEECPACWSFRGAPPERISLKRRA
jgi:hypothetical protein